MFGLFKKKQSPEELQAQQLYDVVVSKARMQAFYEDLNVPDDVDGRFEMISLHQILLLLRLEQLGEEAKDLSQALFDTMFLDMDRSLREMGISDLRIPKHMKRMLNGFNGRTHSYRESLLQNNQDKLIGAIKRNVYGTRKDESSEDEMRVLLGYIEKQWSHIQTLTFIDFKNMQNIFIEEEVKV